MQFSLKYDKNNRYLAWRPINILDHISLSSSSNEKYFRQNCKENQNTHFVKHNYILGSMFTNTKAQLHVSAINTT